jgi:hypothetical protein
MAEDMANDGSLVTSITLNVIAGHSSLPYADCVNLSALPAIHPLRKTLLKFDGYAAHVSGLNIKPAYDS